MKLITSIIDGNRTLELAGLDIMPTMLSAHAQMGYNRAEYAVSGLLESLFDVLGYLGYNIRTHDENGNLVWAGKIVEASVTTPGFTVGFNLEKMANRVRVKYSFTNLDGENEDGETAWAEDAVSIAKYGVKEKILTVADTKLAAAEAKRATFLASHANPVPIITFETGDAAYATLIATGAWNLLDWNYYENSLGKEIYENNNSRAMAIGWVLTGTTFGFNSNRLYDHACRLHHMPDGARFQVTGSHYNNKWFTASSTTDVDTVKSVTSTAFTFDPLDDIRLSGELEDFVDEVMVSVTNSLTNDGYYFVKTPGENRIEVTGGASQIDTEDSGRSITLAMGNNIQVREKTTLERPGYNTTISIPSFKLAQPFRLTTSAGWALNEISCQVYKVGTPSDQLRFSIYSDSAGVPGSSLCSALVTTDDLLNVPSWQSATLSAGYTLAINTTYWLVIDRTGGNSYENYFMVVLGDDPALNTATGLKLKMHDGSAWINENLTEGDVDHYIAFQLWGLSDTLTILKTILEASPYFTAVTITEASGVEDYIFKDGAETVSSEANKIMQAGTATGKRLLIRTNRESEITVVIEAAPTVADSVFYGIDGGRTRSNGAPLELTEAWVGEWVYVVGDNISIMRNSPPLFPVLVMEAQLDVNGGTLRIVPWAMDDDEDEY